MIYSHTQLKGKNKLMMALLKAIEDRGMHLVGVSLEIILCELGSIFFLNLFFSVGDSCC